MGGVNGASAEIEASIRQEIADPVAFREYLRWFHSSMGAPTEAHNFISGLMNPDPNGRLTAEAARDHPWLVGAASPTSEGPKSLSVLSAVSDTIASRLSKFQAQKPLKRSVRMAMSFGAPRAMLESAGRAFSEMDVDGDGLISFDEFSTAMRRHGATDDTELRTQFLAIQQDGTGMIKFSEFVAAVLDDSEVDSNDQLEAAFSRLDRRRVGKLNMQDFKILLSKCFPEDLAKQVLADADKDGDGEINVQEFKAAMRGANATHRKRRYSLVGVAAKLVPAEMSQQTEVAAAATRGEERDAE